MPRWIKNRPTKCCDRWEQKVAEQLNKLSNRWTIRWGFYYRDNKGVQREGDFLILGPEGGLLVLEVKGKPIRHFAETGEWEDNEDHPIFQLDQEWKGVIEEMQATGGPLPLVKKALALPREFVPPTQKEHQGIARDMIFGTGDLANLQQGWNRCFGEASSKPVRDEAKKTFFDTFGRPGLPDGIAAFVSRTEQLFREQFTASYHILDLAERNRQLLVEGRSGSGKTWHAVEKAVRLAQEGEGQDVLLLCYNLALGKLLKELVGHRKLERGVITVFQWEQLAAKIHENCGMPYDPPSPDAPLEERLRFYDEEIPGTLLMCIREAEYAEKLPTFDALVVDEAQDHDTTFPERLDETDPDLCGWWSIYWSLLREGTGAPMALFFDPSQRPPFREMDRFDLDLLMERLSQPAHMRLPQALRYTRPIFEFLSGLKGMGTLELLQELGRPDDLPQGPPVEIYECGEDASAIRAQVEAVLKDWKDRGICTPDEVLLLHLRTTLASSRLTGCDSLVDHRLVDYLERDGQEPGEKILLHTSINKAKGLDATGVIVVGLKPFPMIEKPGYQHAYFMGASRAKQALAIVHC